MTRPTPASPAELAAGLGLDPTDLVPTGRHKAKVRLDALARPPRTRGRLVLVTGMTPTASGEGKTTVSIGLAQGLAALGKRALVALREPSQGPLFGAKGGGTGGGRSRLEPRDEVDLWLSGDLPAVTAAHDLLAAAVDHALEHDSISGLAPEGVTWPRVLDVDDRALRRIRVGLDETAQGGRASRFDITAASEVMAILALATGYEDLRARLARIEVGRTAQGEAVTAGTLGAAGAMAALLRDALHPNLVQTSEGVPALVHAGPFANLAAGTNSVVATRLGLAHADYVVTEAGFGSDLGLEKFVHLVSPVGGFAPGAAVLVATVKALKLHGGVKPRDLDRPDVAALVAGLPNLAHHLENIRGFGLRPVLAVNRFPADSDAELAELIAFAARAGVPAAPIEGFSKGGPGATALASRLLEALGPGPDPAPRPRFDPQAPLDQKLATLVKEVYGGAALALTPAAQAQLATLTARDQERLPVCVAKTPRSLTDDPKVLGRPRGFTVTVRGFEISAGAGFVVALAGELVRMPALPKDPSYRRIDLAPDGRITGLA